MEHSQQAKVYSSAIVKPAKFGTSTMAPTEVFSVHRVVGIVLRRKLMIVGSIGLCLLLGFVYLFLVSPKYTASASIMIDTRRVQLFQQSQDAVVSDAIVDTAAIDSQVEILRSEDLGREVILRLDLLNNEKFMKKAPDNTPGLLSFFMGTDSSAERSPEDLQEIRVRNALKRYMKDIQVKRAGTSYVIEISFRAKDPQLAASVANQVISVYTDDEVKFKTQVIKKTTEWLEGRIADLRDQASAADRELQNFKSTEGLMDANGRPIDEQQLSELTSQLAAAQLEAVQSQSRYERILDVMKSGVPDASVADSLKNDVIVKLRQEYNDLARRQAEFEQRYGSTHQATEQLRAQLRQTQRQLREELGRIAESYGNDYQVSQARLENLNKNKDSLYKRVADIRLSQVRARELESKSQSLRAMHDSFLQRYVQAVQQLSSPTADTRVVAKAIPPLDASAPNTLLILTGSALLGTLAGFAGAFGRETLDTSIRTRNQASNAFRTSCLGLLPFIDKHLNFGVRLQSKSGRQIAIDGGLYGYSVANKSSLYSETLRYIKYAVDRSRDPKMGYRLGITSIGEGEGKTTTSINLACYLASLGYKVLLLDCDFKRPGLSKVLLLDQSSEEIEFNTKAVSTGDLLWVETKSGLHILPLGSSGPSKDCDKIISSGAFSTLMNSMAQHYEYIIADLPPVGPVVDVKVMTPSLDGVVMVCKWGKHRFELASNFTSDNIELREKLIGVVLSKVDLRGYKSLAVEDSEYTDSEYYSTHG